MNTVVPPAAARKPVRQSWLQRCCGLRGCGALLVWMGLGLLCPAVTWADEILITLYDSVTVKTPLVLLGDVARVSSTNAELAERLSALTIMPTPLDRKVLRITPELLRTRLLAAGENMAQFEFTGRSVTLVQAAPPPLPKLVTPDTMLPEEPAPPPDARLLAERREQAAAIVAEAFSQQFATPAGVPGLRARVQVTDPVATALLAASPAQVRFQMAGVELGGPQLWTLSLAQPNGAGRSEFFTVEALVEQVPMLLTVRRPLVRGQRVTPDDLTTMPAGELSGLTDAAQVIGKEAVRTLKPGAPIALQDLAVTMLVRPNDVVTVRVRYPGITVQRPFKATTGGGFGSEIQLVSLDDARELVQARVTGFHQAEIAPRATTAEDTTATGSPTAQASLNTPLPTTVRTTEPTTGRPAPWSVPRQSVPRRNR